MPTAVSVIAASFVIVFLLSRAESGAAPIDSGKRLMNVPFREDFLRASARHGVDACLLAAIADVESDFNPFAIGSVGEIGLTQLKLGTARDRLHGVTVAQLKIPSIHLDVAASHLSWLAGQGVPLPSRVDAWQLGIGDFKRGEKNDTYRRLVLASREELC